MSIPWNLYHLPAIAIILIACAVMLWLIFREAKVIKLNINIDPDLAFAHHGAFNRWPLKPTRFELVWRGTEGIPDDWDIVLLNTVVGRIQPPMTVQFLGRKFTVIVDGRNDEVEGSKVGGIDLPLCKPDGGVDYGSGFTKIKIMLLVRNGNLQQTDALRNVYAEERD